MSKGRPIAVYPPRRATLTIRGPLARGDLPGLFARACTLIEDRRVELLSCEVGGIAPDAVAVEALARLALAARRHGCEVRLHELSPELRSLVAFVGLAEVLRE